MSEQLAYDWLLRPQSSSVVGDLWCCASSASLPLPRFDARFVCSRQLFADQLIACRIRV